MAPTTNGRQENEETYDIIIIGAGTAGCVLANRLSEDPNISILVLEAGQDLSHDENVYTPGLCTNLLGNEKYDWKYLAEPDEGINGRQIAHPRGKLIGGTSAINSFALIYPSKRELDAWADLGNKGWEWENVKPYFRKFQTIYPPPEDVKKAFNLAHSDETIASSNGPLQVSFPAMVGPLQRLWVAWDESFRTLGLGNKGEVLEGEGLGGNVSTCHVDGERRERSHAGRGFLEPVRGRGNLRVLTGVLVQKVLFDEEEKGDGAVLVASGVEYMRGGEKFEVRAKREVILAAGAFNTPQLLELSGIGNPDLLGKCGIEVKYANPGVGENLQDHINAAVSFEVADSVGPANPLGEEESRRLYETERSGPWATQTAFCFAYVPLAPFIGAEGMKDLESLLDQEQKDESFRHAFIRKTTLTPSAATSTANASRRPASFPAEGNYTTFSAMLSHSFSTGSVHITSKDVSEKPRVQFNYYSNPLDLEIHARHIQSMEKVAQTEPMVSYLKPGGRRLPPVGQPGEALSLEAAKDICRNYSRTNYHPSSTAAMIPEAKGGVVNERLVVYGTKNLRVVDASVMPIIPRGNIIATVYAIAEKGADLVSEDLGIRRTS